MNLLFLAPYPTDENSKDGMISRIKSVDDKFVDLERTYLNIHFLKKGYGIKKSNNVYIYDVNLFAKLLLIIKLLVKSDLVYCHSIYSLCYTWPFLVLSYKKKIVLDIHGVVPDENKEFYGRKMLSYYLFFVEWVIFHRLSIAICVTSAMEQVYKERYEFANCRYLTYGIIPIELLALPVVPPKSNEDGIIEVIYSGGIQQWQNIGLMLDTIAKNQSNLIHYTILTGNVGYIKNALYERGIYNHNIDVLSCNSSELINYYKNAHYAFILRDDSIVNRVANPTKLIEYLYYGLTPIVLSPNIGDYCEYGYEYISLQDFSIANITTQNSDKNKNIAKKMVENHINTPLLKYIFDDGLL